MLRNSQHRSVNSGFTFMELMIVMVIIAILAAMTVPSYVKHLQRAKEVALQGNLWAIRRAIDSFTSDKERSPQSLDELVQSGYLRSIPKDPVCDECQWSIVAASNQGSGLGGVDDVKSSAPGADSNGKAYLEY